MAESWHEPGAHCLEFSPLITDKQETKEKRITIPPQGLWKYLLRRWPVIICRMPGAFSLKIFFQLLCFYFLAAYRILVPWPRIEPVPLSVKMHSPEHWTAGNSLHFLIWNQICGSDGKESACSAGDLGLIPGPGRPPGSEIPSILAWRISWTEEPRGLQSMDWKESDTTEQLTLLLSYFWPETNMIIWAREFW